MQFFKHLWTHPFLTVLMAITLSVGLVLIGAILMTPKQTSLSGPGLSRSAASAGVEMRKAIPVKVTQPASTSTTLLTPPTLSNPPLGLVETTLGRSDSVCRPINIVADQAAERLYLLCYPNWSKKTEMLLVLNGRTGEPEASLQLDTLFPEYTLHGYNAGSLVLDASAQRLYLRSQMMWQGVLVLDTATLTKVRWLPLDNDYKLVAAGGGRLYVWNSDGLTAYSDADLTKLAHIPRWDKNCKDGCDSRVSEFLAYNPINHRLYTMATTKTLQIRHDDTLAVETTLPLTGQELIGQPLLNSQEDRLYTLTKQEGKVQLMAVDGQTQAITSLDLNLYDGKYTDLKIIADEASGRIHLLYTDRPSDLYSAVWLIIDGPTLNIIKKYQPDGRCIPSYNYDITLDTTGRLLLFCPGEVYDYPIVSHYDPATGRPDSLFTWGYRSVAGLAHPQDGRFYTIDSLGVLKVLDGTSLQTLDHHSVLPGLCPEKGPVHMALDPKQKRLFVSHNGQTLALNSDTLDVTGQLSLAGPLAVDTAGGRLFGVDPAKSAEGHNMLRVFDTANLTRLQLTKNVSGEILYEWPDYHISTLTFADPVKRLFMSPDLDNLAVCRNYWIYNPDTITPTGVLDVNEPARMEYLAFSPDGRRTYVTFQNEDTTDSGIEEFVRLAIFDQNNQLLKQIHGMFGPLATDDRYIYLLQKGPLFWNTEQYLLALDAQALETPNQPYLAAVLPLTRTYHSLTLAQKRLYLWGPQHAATITVTDLLAHRPNPSLQAGLVETVTSPSSLEFIGHLGGDAGQVVAKGTYVYAAFGPELAVLDVTHPRQPDRVGYVLLPGRRMSAGSIINDLAIADNYVYAATYDAGLRIIDVSDPTAPTEVGFYAPTLPWLTKNIRQVAVVGSYAYLNMSEWGLRVLDVSNPAAPVEVGSYQFDLGWMQGMAVIEAAGSAYAYILLEDKKPLSGNQLRLLDLSDPTRPIELDLAAIPLKIKNILVEGNYLYLTHQGEEATILDISNPTAPVEVEVDPHAGLPYRGLGLVIMGDYAFGRIDGNSLKVMDISDPTAPRQVGVYRSEGFGRVLALKGNYAYLSGYLSLHIVDVSDPTDPTIAGSYQFDDDPAVEILDMAVAGEYLYLLNESNNLRVLDVSTPTAPVEVGVYPLPSEKILYHHIAAVKNYVYIGGFSDFGNSFYGEGDLLIIDVSDPVHPARQGSYPLRVTEMFMYDQSLYIYGGHIDNTWHILDISNPANPTPVETSLPLLPTIDFSTNVDVNFGLTPPYLYLFTNNYHDLNDYYLHGISSPRGVLRVVDFSDPFDPVTIGAHEIPASGHNTVVAAAEYIYVADGYSLFIFKK